MYTPYYDEHHLLKMNSLLRIQPAVRHALANGKPVVALESTIITHGLPYPANLQTALAIEQTVRDQGAIPATTAFIDGKAYVGLEQDQIERLAEIGKKATKTSRRDVAGVLANGKGSVGATTVSGTMILAHLAKIPIFGTGGIGGVHRGGENSLDVSADLTELSRTPIAVFCSGCKSILDIPRTLEYLETMGVNVHSFNPSAEFPAFYTANSGQKVTPVLDAVHAAKIIHSGRSFGLQNGYVFGVPIPQEFEKEGTKIQKAVEQAVRESAEKGIDRSGKEATPWLLQRVGELTKGNSIVSNRGLVLNNVKVAAQVANELQKLTSKSKEQSMEEQLEGFMPAFPKASQTSGENSNKQKEHSILVIGCAAVDLTGQRHITEIESMEKEVATTWPGKVSMTLGGVARNMAEGIHRIIGNRDVQVKLVSPIGKDVFGSIIVKGLQEIGLSTDGLTYDLPRTFIAMLQLDKEGDLITGIVDIDDTLPNFEQTRAMIEKESPKMIVFDGNVGKGAMEAILTHNNGEQEIIFEPTSVEKSTRLIEVIGKISTESKSKRIRYPTIITPNEYEVNAMHLRAVKLGLISEQELPVLEGPVAKVRSDQTLLPQQKVIHDAAKLAKLMKGTLLVKGGKRGVLIARYQSINNSVHLSHHSGKLIDSSAIVNTTGAGDSFASAIVAGVFVGLFGQTNKKVDLNNEKFWETITSVAQDSALLTLQSGNAVSPRLNTIANQLEGFHQS